MENDSLENTDIIELLKLNAKYCLDLGYTVIIEGIFATGKYLDVLSRVIDYAECDTFVYYLDVSLEETLRRHATKPESADFGEDKVREWYKQDHHLGIANEIIIPESSVEDTLTLIKSYF